ncbi:predicted protein [Streptomyces sp. SPB78]|nr:predicted protein [Streptomyces sp. SPB78]
MGRPPAAPSAARRETKYTHTPASGRHWPWTHVIIDALERLALLPNPG